MNRRPATKCLIIFLAVVQIVGGPNIVNAEVDKRFMEENDIIYYDPTSTVCSTTGGGTNVNGADNVSKMWNYLIDKGLADYQAAGILGNIQQESEFSPFRQESSMAWPSGGYGIVQWTGSRRRAIEKDLQAKLGNDFSTYYSPKYGASPSQSNGYVPSGVPIEINDKFLAAQLDYLYQESTTRTVRSGLGFSGTEWDAIKSSRNLREASDIWLKSFERPRDQSDSHAEKRAKYGAAIYTKITGQAPPTGSSDKPSSGAATPTNSTEAKTSTVSLANNCGNNPNFNPGDLQSAVLAYAWPDYQKGKTAKKPEYEAAVKEAKANGKYTGGACYGGGVDCGAFVTILLNNSGWDPAYNSSGKGGATGNCSDKSTQWGYLCANWEEIGRGGSMDTAKLQPGDVAMYDGHTFIYVGDIPGFNSKIASASLCKHSPMAAVDSLSDGRIHWFRKKGGPQQ